MNKYLFLGLLFCLQFTILHAQPKYEVRGVWLTTLGGLDWPQHKAYSPESINSQQQELIAILDRLQALHINTVFLQTRLRGDMIYPSAYEPFAEALTGHAGKDPGYDPLKFAIDECHKRGIELHAWLVAIPVGNARQVRTQGKRSIVSRHPELCKRFNDSWYMDPGLPATADYLGNLAAELTTKYNIDGLQLDYIRYPENGINFPDQATYKRYGQGKSRDTWRRDNITHIVRTIYQRVKAIKPWIKVSSSPIGKFSNTDRYNSFGWNAYQAVYQDVKSWLSEGIQDMICPMMYFKGNQFYPFLLDWLEAANGRFIVPGLGIYFLDSGIKDWELDEVSRQIYFSRENQSSGQAYFRNLYLLNNVKSLFDDLSTNFYRYPACVPPMRWADSIPPLRPQSGKWNARSNIVTLTWDPVKENTPIYYRIYGADNFPVNTSQPRHLIADRLTETQFTRRYPEGQEPLSYWAVTAVDAFGNESEALQLRPMSGPNVAFAEDLPLLHSGETLVIQHPDGTEVLRYSSVGAKRVRLVKGLYRFVRLSANGASLESGFFRVN